MSHTTFISLFMAICALVTSLPLYADRLPPQRITYDVPLVPIASLSRVAVTEPAWTKVRVIDQMDNDLFLVEDITGRVILFLPTDSLINLDIKQDQELIVFGRLDLSPVGPSKNEFYAEKIYLPKLTVK